VKKRMLVAVVLAAVASGAAAPSAQRGGFVPAGVKVGGLKVGGMPVEQARAALNYAYNRPLHFVFYGKRWKVRPNALGSSIDLQQTIKNALNAREGQSVPLSVTVDSGRIAQYSTWLEHRLSVEPQDATATLTSRLTPVLHRAKPGLQVRASQTGDRIEAALRSAVRPVLRPSAHTVPATMTLQNFGPVVVVHRGSNVMYVYKGTTLWRTFGVATGQAIYPTPLGNWHVVDMQRNPWWRPPDSPWAQGLKPIPPGPGNPLGTRWMGLDAAGVGMHGTPDDASIGYSASHGCIRMHIPDAEWLFNQVKIGTPVFVVAA
jgi:lipoprotein-anchoring transpeptidase ErfK/SrfK